MALKGFHCSGDSRCGLLGYDTVIQACQNTQLTELYDVTHSNLQSLLIIVIT
jgi:hypothetical protein